MLRLAAVKLEAIKRTCKSEKAPQAFGRESRTNRCFAPLICRRGIREECVKTSWEWETKWETKLCVFKDQMAVCAPATIHLSGEIRLGPGDLKGSLLIRQVTRLAKQVRGFVAGLCDNFSEISQIKICKLILQVFLSNFMNSVESLQISPRLIQETLTMRYTLWDTL